MEGVNYFNHCFNPAVAWSGSDINRSNQPRPGAVFSGRPQVSSNLAIKARIMGFD
jgi:hypothetical protein